MHTLMIKAILIAIVSSILRGFMHKRSINEFNQIENYNAEKILVSELIKVIEVLRQENNFRK